MISMPLVLVSLICRAIQSNCQTWKTRKKIQELPQLRFVVVVVVYSGMILVLSSLTKYYWFVQQLCIDCREKYWGIFICWLLGNGCLFGFNSMLTTIDYMYLFPVRNLSAIVLLYLTPQLYRN